MFIEAIILGCIIGYIRKGSFDNLQYLRINGMSLIVLAGLIQAAPLVLCKFAIFSDKLHFFTPISLVLLILCLIINLSKSGVWLILIGSIINLMVILMNKMRMPISFGALHISGRTDMAMPISMGEVINYIPFKNAFGITGYLGKIIPLPSFYPFAKVLSIGDLFIVVGIIVLVSISMRRYRFRRY